MAGVEEEEEGGSCGAALCRLLLAPDRYVSGGGGQPHSCLLLCSRAWLAQLRRQGKASLWSRYSLDPSFRLWPPDLNLEEQIV